MAPHSTYFAGSGRRDEFVSSKNSQNQGNLTGFTFEVEVKKTKEPLVKKKSNKSSLSKEESSKDKSSEMEPR